jgi:hypothetical protein
MTETHSGMRCAIERLERCYSGGKIAWEQCFQPRWERGNFASRYHLVYPGLAFWILLRAKLDRAPTAARHNVQRASRTSVLAVLAHRTW